MLRRLLNKIESIYKYRYFSRNEAGAYNYLLKKVYKSTDVNFIENIFQLDYFREILEPQPLHLERLKKVLVFAPHQDDEVLGCGGTLLKLAETDCHITIGFLTNGAEPLHPIGSVSIRREEAKNVCDVLGAEMRELGIDNISMEIDPSKLTTLIEWLDEDWDAIFSVWPLDQPPKHRVCSYILGKALSNSNYQGLVNFYAVHTDLLPNIYQDISDNINAKQELIKKYPSQLSNQRLEHLSLGLDAWRSRFLPVSSEIRYIETFMQMPAKSYAHFQSVYEKVNSKKLLKANDVCISSFNKLKKL